MKLSRKLITGAVCLSVLLEATACGNSGTTATITTTPPVTTNTLDDDIANPVDVEEFVDKEAEKLENPNITYFGYYDMRVAGDIKPAVKLFEETYGGKIDYYQVAWGERIDKLQVLIAGGDSPDLTDMDSTSFPQLISKNVYEDLTDYIDLSQPQWAGFEELIKQYQWNGKNYYYPWFATALSNYMMYNKTLFEEYGMDMPIDMYNSGEWTWSAFKQAMIDFVQASGSSDTTGIYGSVSVDLICTTGTPVIGVNADGKIVNNMKSVEVERAVTFLEELRKEKLATKTDGMWGNELDPLAAGKSAFLSCGQYMLEGFIDKYPDIEIDFVPFPRDEKSDKYYLLASTFGYMVPSGSKNIEGAAAFINMMRTCKTDTAIATEMKKSTLADKSWSEEQYDFMASFEKLGDFNVVADISTGFDSNTTTVISDMLFNITFEQNEPQSWAVLRDSNEGLIDDAISTYNG